MSRPPETPRSKEQEPQPYYLASRFPTKRAAEQPYVSAEATIHEMDCDLSAYRFMRQWHESNTNPWYVLVIGVKPEPAVEERIKTVLSQGELASVPQEAVERLYARRLEEIQKGPWVEHHYTPYMPHAERINWVTRRFRELTGNVNVLLAEVSRTPIFLPAFPPDIAALPYISRYAATKVLAPDLLDEDGKPIILGYTILSRQGLKNTLTRPENIGHWVVNDQIVRFNNHLPIVDEGDFLYAIERLSPTYLDGTLNPFFATKRSFYLKQHYAQSTAVLQNHLVSLDADFTIPPRTYAKKGEDAEEGETGTGYGFIPRGCSTNSLKYRIATEEVDGFFFYLLKQKLQTAEGFEDYHEREQKEKEERANALGTLDMQIVACDRAMKKLTKRLVQLSTIDEEEEEDLTDEQRAEKEKQEKELVKAIRDEYNRFSSEHEALTRRREVLLQQTSQSQKRRTYKELILKVLTYWPDAQVYPPEALIPPEELPMIVDTFVTQVGLDTLSPHFYKMVIVWRDPAWGEDTLICFRSGNPAIQWSDEEDAILRAHYPTTTRDEIMRLLPMRSYASIQSRASFYTIRKMRTHNTEHLPYGLSLQDYTVMQEIGMSLEALQSGQGVVNLAGASLVSLSA